MGVAYGRGIRDWGVSIVQILFSGNEWKNSITISNFAFAFDCLWLPVLFEHSLEAGGSLSGFWRLKAYRYDYTSLAFRRGYTWWTN